VTPKYWPFLVRVVPSWASKRVITCYYPPHSRQEMIDRMLGGQAVLLKTSVPEQALHQ
jgi:hypothetical protein